MGLKLTIFNLIFVFFITCCQNSIPVEEDFYGVWISRSSNQIIFHKDGTFEAKEMPLDYLWSVDRKDETISGNGKWQIKNTNTVWQIQLSFEETNHSDFQRKFGSQMEISGQGLLENKADWNLFLWKDDIGAERLEFKK